MLILKSPCFSATRCLLREILYKNMREMRIAVEKYAKYNIYCIVKFVLLYFQPVQHRWWLEVVSKV